MRATKVKDLLAKMSSYTILKVFDDNPSLSAQHAFMAFIKVGYRKNNRVLLSGKLISEMYTATDEYSKSEILNFEVQSIFPGVNPECYIGVFVKPKKKRRKKR